MLGHELPKDSPLHKKLKGATETEIVKAGVEDMMQSAAKRHWKFAVENDMALRDAVYVLTTQNLANFCIYRVH